MSKTTVGIVGAGSIGLSFALVFARAGGKVRLYDPDAEARGRVAEEITARVDNLAQAGLLSLTATAILAQIMVVADLADLVSGCELVLECVPERLALKQAIFAELDALAPASVILASASSALMASQFAADLAGRARCLVAHPGNPPHLIPVVEVVPAPFTDAAVVARLVELLHSVDQVPIRLNKEIEGFVFNRLQGAVLREAYCLVRDGVVSVADLDKVMHSGLGLRWAAIGPFETVDLNTRGGIAQHALNMGPAYARMGQQRGQNDPWTPELVATVAAERRRLLPLADWDSRGRWRDQMLMRIIKAKGGH
ncbi:MAG: 3-hydroxyacyl-CoA dehydrogenase [Neisseriaceae bacterium]|nr:3-hydroxyacyl-CoA dehydrogenase [Neisseriaceae bacterium]